MGLGIPLDNAHQATEHDFCETPWAAEKPEWAEAASADCQAGSIRRMKRCTYCGKEHPDEATACSLDQQPLESIASPDTAVESSDSSPSKGWPPQIVVPAILWLVANFLLVGLFTFGATFLFGLLTALWAAIDSSKLQSRGSRELGIAFKPVVVFAAVAFFLWGFGFIWYLVMRHRVKTAPIDLEIESATATAQPAGPS